MAATGISKRDKRYFVTDGPNNVICFSTNTSYSIQMECRCICFLQMNLLDQKGRVSSKDTEQFPNILQLNLVQFTSKFYVSNGELRRRPKEVVIRTFPTYSTNSSGKHYGKYCRYQLIKYKPWSETTNSAWDEADDTDEVHIQSYHDFLASDSAQHYLPLFAQELEEAHLYNEQQQNDEDEDDEPQQQEEAPEEWMLLCRLNQHYDNSQDQPNSQNHSQIDWSAPATNLRESASWITKQRNTAFEDPSAAARQQRHHTVNLTLTKY